MNNSSIVVPKYWAVLWAKVSEALYLPFSNEMIVCLVTLNASASSCCVTLRDLRISCIRFFKKSPPIVDNCVKFTLQYKYSKLYIICQACFTYFMAIQINKLTKEVDAGLYVAMKRAWGAFCRRRSLRTRVPTDCELSSCLPYVRHIGDGFFVNAGYNLLLRLLLFFSFLIICLPLALLWGCDLTDRAGWEPSPTAGETRCPCNLPAF